jgi:hypothetical protein
MPGDPKECREHAKNCLRLAAEAPNEVGKRRFEELARTWLRLASDLEAAKVLLERWGPSKVPERSICSVSPFLSREAPAMGATPGLRVPRGNL